MLEFTGALTPNATGDYIETGVYDSHAYYHNAAGYFLWWSQADDRWYVSIALGLKGLLGWMGNTSAQINTYNAEGTALGVGDMHIHP
jgi:hypothetical protein